MAKAKTKAAASRKVAKVPARPAKAPKKAATAKPAKASAAKAAKPVAAKPAAAKPAAAKPAAVKAVAEKASAKIVAPMQSRKAEPLSLPAATAAAAPVAKPPLPVRNVTSTSAPRADLPPPDGFTLLVDGHFKNCFDDLKGARAAASELKGRFPMLRVEIYDAAKKARLPA